MGMKSAVFIVILLTSSFSVTIFAQDQVSDFLPYPNRISIFSENVVRSPINFGCNPCSARHGVKYRQETSSILWQWQNKNQCWCGWAFENLGLSDFNDDIQDNYVLRILYSGIYTGTPSPQVKFMDGDGNATDPQKFSDYVTGTSSSATVSVLIPISEFDIEFSIEKSNVQKLQFDAGWNSSQGNIEIESVELLRMGGNSNQ